MEENEQRAQEVEAIGGGLGDGDGEAEERECRVCRCGSEPDRPLFYPCACKGSIKYVHQDCLLQWLNMGGRNGGRQRKSCELCNQQFTFRPIYKPGAPRCLGPVQLFRGISAKASRFFPKVFRVTLVLFTWGTGLPVITLSFTRLFFSRSQADLRAAGRLLISYHRRLMELPGDILVGIMLCVTILCLTAIISHAYKELETYLKGLMRQHAEQVRAAQQQAQAAAQHDLLLQRQAQEREDEAFLEEVERLDQEAEQHWARRERRRRNDNLHLAPSRRNFLAGRLQAFRNRPLDPGPHEALFNILRLRHQNWCRFCNTVAPILSAQPRPVRQLCERSRMSPAPRWRDPAGNSTLSLDFKFDVAVLEPDDTVAGRPMAEVAWCQDAALLKLEYVWFRSSHNLLERLVTSVTRVNERVTQLQALVHRLGITGIHPPGDARVFRDYLLKQKLNLRAHCAALAAYQSALPAAAAALSWSTDTVVADTPAAAWQWWQRPADVLLTMEVPESNPLNLSDEYCAALNEDGEEESHKLHVAAMHYMRLAQFARHLALLTSHRNGTRAAHAAMHRQTAAAAAAGGGGAHAAVAAAAARTSAPAATAAEWQQRVSACAEAFDTALRRVGAEFAPVEGSTAAVQLRLISAETVEAFMAEQDAARAAARAAQATAAAAEAARRRGGSVGDSDGDDMEAAEAAAAHAGAPLVPDCTDRGDLLDSAALEQLMDRLPVHTVPPSLGPVGEGTGLAPPPMETAAAAAAAADVDAMMLRRAQRLRAERAARAAANRMRWPEQPNPRYVPEPAPPAAAAAAPAAVAVGMPRAAVGRAWWVPPEAQQPRANAVGVGAVERENADNPPPPVRVVEDAQAPMPLGEVVGLDGPLRGVFNGVLHTVAYNFLFLAAFQLVPFWVGVIASRVVFWPYKLGNSPDLPNATAHLIKAMTTAPWIKGLTESAAVATVKAGLKSEGAAMIPQAFRNLFKTVAAEVPQPAQAPTPPLPFPHGMLDFWVPVKDPEAVQLWANLLTLHLGWGTVVMVLAPPLIMYLMHTLHTQCGGVRKVIRSALGTDTAANEVQGGQGGDVGGFWQFRHEVAEAAATAGRHFKGSFLVMLELAVLPFCLGVLMDVAMLRVFGMTLPQRMTQAHSVPIFSLVVHWGLGVGFVMAAGFFMRELRRVLNEDALKRVLPMPRQDNLNEEQMFAQVLERPFIESLNRLIVYFLQYVVLVMLCVYIPVRLPWMVLPAKWHKEVALDLTFASGFMLEVQLPMELLLFHVVLPIAIERGHLREGVQSILRGWLCWLCTSLGMDHVLHPDALREYQNLNAPGAPQANAANANANEEPQQPPAPQPGNGGNDGNAQQAAVPPVAAAAVAAGDGAAAQAPGEAPHNAAGADTFAAAFSASGAAPELAPVPGTVARLLRLVGIDVYEGDLRTRAVALLRVAALLTANALALLALSTFLLHVPVHVGRTIFSAAGLPVENDVYSITVGLIATWGAVTLGCMAGKHLLLTRLQREALVRATRTWGLVLVKWAVLCSLWLGAVPLLIGTYFEALVSLPLRSFPGDTPKVNLFQDWALGLVFLKIWMRCVMLAGGGGPNAVARPEEGPPGLWGHRWWARRFERVRARGIRGVEFNWAAYHICFRILNSVGELYFVPYFLTKGVAPLLLEDPVTLDTLHRLGCPLYLAGHVLISLMGFVLKWMLKLHDTIRDEAFLVGVQLANSELHAAEEDAHRLAITNGHPSAVPAILPAAAAAPPVAAGGAHEHAD